MYLYFILFFSCRFLIQHVHPATAPVAFVGVLGLFYSLMFLLKAGCTDPGFIPRARPDEATYNQTLGELGKYHIIIKFYYIHVHIHLHM